MKPLYAYLVAFSTGLAGPAHAAMSLASRDLAEGTAMPSKHIYPRCGGKNISPQLSWAGAPGAARSFVLTMIDLDVKPAQWSHWVVVNLPPTVSALAQGDPVLPGHAKAVVSNFGDAAYAGPCPPPGTGVHHYQFMIWALPVAQLDLPADEKATELTARLAHLALDRASLTTLVEATASR